MAITNRRHLPDIRTAIELYYTKVELSSDDICRLFGVGSSGATKLKRPALELMAQRKVHCWLPHAVNTKLAYEAWGIDVKDYEERLAKLRKLKLIDQEVSSSEHP